MIQLARLVDGPARELRQKVEQHYDEPLRQAYARIADARFATLGATGYPDATFTLRLAFGTVKGYEEDGKKIAPYTVVGGAYEHAKEHGDRPPFQLPTSWIKAKEQLDLKTPMNFVSTADIIGGNSGSPVVNRAGEFVGIIFDGNIQSLVGDYAYSDVQARALSVDSRAIIESLRSIYDAEHLVKELLP
ncbi:MAG: S46 family peptidase, partial [Opitutaceae bacterium]|nr:S46 family peptidase [Opitutaceae bacterium]